MIAAGAFLLLGSATSGAQESKDSGQWPPKAPAPGKAPIPRSFTTGITTPREDMEALIEYGLSLPDPPPLWLPEDFHRTADRLGMPEAGQKGMAADRAKPTPRLPSGRPDLNGPWKPVRYAGALAPVSGSPAPRAAPQGPPPEPTPEQKTLAIAFATLLRPANRPVYKESQDQRKQLEMWRRNFYTDPGFKCFPTGLPRISAPAFVVQTDQSLTFLYAARSDGNVWRYIPIGGEFKADAPASLYGQSIGHWEGDTLVVEVRNLDPTTWFGDFGLFHGPNVKVTERYRRVGDILVYQSKVEDPQLLAEPYYSTARYNMPGQFLPVENERCVRPDVDDWNSAKVFPGPFLPEGNLNSK